MCKILIVAYDCNPYRGSEAMFAFSWVNILSKYYNVTLITDIRHKRSLEDKNCGFEIVYCKYIPEVLNNILCKANAHNINYRLFIKSVKEMLESNKIRNYDLIHCLTPAGFYAYNDLYTLGKPVIAGPLGGGIKLPEGFEDYNTLKYIIRNSFYSHIQKNKKWKAYYSNCNSILIGTKYLLEHLPCSVYPKTIELFDTVVDTDKFTPSSSIKKNSDVITIVYSGRMELTKGCLLLVEAFKLLLKDGYTQARLIMLGEGSQYKKLCKVVKKEKLEKYIDMKGRVTNDVVKEFLHAADIFCLPSLKEPGGTSILEAMSCELPIITTNYGGPSISVTDECGIKIDALNHNQYVLSLKKALKYLIDNPSERRRMGQNGRHRVINEYSYERLEEKIVHLYEDILRMIDKNAV